MFYVRSAVRDRALYASDKGSRDRREWLRGFFGRGCGERAKIIADKFGNGHIPARSLTFGRRDEWIRDVKR